MLIIALVWTFQSTWFDIQNWNGFSTKSSQIFLNDLHTAMPLDSLLHFGIQLINIRYQDSK